MVYGAPCSSSRSGPRSPGINHIHTQGIANQTKITTLQTCLEIEVLILKYKTHNKKQRTVIKTPAKPPKGAVLGKGKTLRFST